MPRRNAGGIPEDEALQWSQLREAFRARMKVLNMNVSEFSRACGFSSTSSACQFLNGKDVVGKERLLRAANVMGGISMTWLDKTIPYHRSQTRRTKTDTPSPIVPQPQQVPQQVPLPATRPMHINAKSIGTTTTDADRFAALRKGLDGLTREERQRWITIMELFLDAQ